MKKSPIRYGMEGFFTWPDLGRYLLATRPNRKGTVHIVEDPVTGLYCLREIAPTSEPL